MTTGRMDRDLLVEELRRKLADLESSFRSCSAEPPRIVPTGIEPLNELLPGGGFRTAALVEWLAAGEGTGAVMLALMAAVPLLRDGQTCIIVDDRGEFYPAAAAALGIRFEQLILVHPPHKDVLWTLEQALRCRGVAVTIGWLGRVPERVLRRLQLAAETGGGTGMLFRPLEVRKQPTWAHLRLLASPLPAVSPSQKGRRMRLDVLYCQGGKSGQAVEVSIDDETGDVHLVPPLAPARDARQAT